MVIYWHKKDFRLFDNPALQKALDLCSLENLELLPIMGIESDLVIDAQTSYEFGTFWQFGMASAILPLYKNYNYFGLIAGLFYEPVLNYLQNILKEKKITYLVSHQEHGTHGTYVRDKKVADFCRQNGIKWIEIQPSGVIRNLQSRNTRDAMVKKYLNSNIISIPKFDKNSQLVIDRNFWKSLIAKNKIVEVEFNNLENNIGSKYNLRSASEKSALSTLQDFISKRASGYRGGISSPNTAIDNGSRLSQFLAFGSISCRFVHQSYWAQIRASKDNKIRAGILGSMKRLFWREHFIQRIETSANMPQIAINPDFNNIVYAAAEDLFEAFKKGRTGEPLIDACIRCLTVTGFINFRMRALLISYAVFGLDLNWREVGKFLATLFLDYEPGIHWSQVQMQSGVTGINTIRVYSPSKQLLDQDPECVFVKKWIPELANIDNIYILDYLKSDLSKQSSDIYPVPIVDYKTTSKINKAKVYNIRKIANKDNAKATFIKHGSRKKLIKPKKLKKVNQEIVLQSESILL
ncbi:MAG: deoxyribodipyrimidine photo-lyase [candidate division SR1 bacterium]|nr:deoxyribodipyrimidine photo-lyase [candidate division SR1 bacterium]